MRILRKGVCNMPPTSRLRLTAYVLAYSPFISSPSHQILHSQMLRHILADMSLSGFQRSILFLSCCGGLVRNALEEVRQARHVFIFDVHEYLNVTVCDLAAPTSSAPSLHSTLKR